MKARRDAHSAVHRTPQASQAAPEGALTFCVGCGHTCMHTERSAYIPRVGAKPIQSELCTSCRERIQRGDKRLMEIVEFRLLLWA